MATKKDQITDIKRIALMLYEQSKILDGEKPSDPVNFSKNIVDTIYSSIQ